MSQLLTIQQLAEQLQVKEQTIYNWTSAGKIPFVKVGGKLRFNQVEIDKWIGKRSLKASYNF